jgi:hypothetical protein
MVTTSQPAASFDDADSRSDEMHSQLEAWADELIDLRRSRCEPGVPGLARCLESLGMNQKSPKGLNFGDPLRASPLKLVHSAWRMFS